MILILCQASRLSNCGWQLINIQGFSYCLHFSNAALKNECNWDLDHSLKLMLRTYNQFPDFVACLFFSCPLLPNTYALQITYVISKRFDILQLQRHKEIGVNSDIRFCFSLLESDWHINKCLITFGPSKSGILVLNNNVQSLLPPFQKIIIYDE